MLIQSQIITKASGSLGGLTGSRNRFGMYFRQRSNPVNPNSSLQAIVRSRLAALTAAWGALTTPQKQAWDNYAAQVPRQNKLGETIYLTGFNHFVRTNMIVLQCGGSQISAAPSSLLLPGADESFDISPSEATQSLAVTFDDTAVWCTEDGAFMPVFGGLPRNTEVSFFGGPWRFAGAIAGDSTTPPTSPATITSAYGFVSGQYLWAYGRLLRADGRLSDPFRTNKKTGA